MTLDELADRTRLKVYARRIEPIENSCGPVPWGYLRESERIQWREVAWAASEVLGVEVEAEAETNA